MRLALSLLVGLFALSAQAGGIGFKKEYVGTHPISNTAIKLEFTDGERGIALTVDRTLGRAENLVQRFVHRDAFEAVFSLRAEREEDEKIGTEVAKIVTTGDCQIVERLAIIFPSGVRAILQAKR